MKIITITTILVLLLGGGISTVAAQTSLPGEVLYPVKTLVEDIELGLVTNPEIKFQIAAKLANERLEEIQTLIENEKPVPEQAYFEWQMQLWETLECALQSENPSAKLLQVREMVVQQARQSNEGELRGEPIPNFYKNTLQSQMQLMDAGIAEPQKLASELDYMFNYVQKNGKDQLETQFVTPYLESDESLDQKSSSEMDDYKWMFQTGLIDEEDEEDDEAGKANHLNSGNQGDNENGDNGGENGGLNGDGNDSSGGDNGGSGGNGGGNGGGGGGGG